MARVSRPDEEGTDPTVDPNAELGGAALPDAGGGGGGGAPSAAPARSRFMDISRLLNANQGRGQEIANKAIAGAGALAGQAQQQLGAAQGAFQQQVAAGTPAQYGVAPPAVPQGGGLGGGGRGAVAGVNGNTAPNIAAAQTAAQSSYTGPTALGNSSVNLTPVTAAYDKAGQAYQALPQSASGKSGGAGVLDDALAQHEAGGQLRQVAGRFQGLRDQLSRATTNTIASDAAKAATAKSAAAGQAAVDYNNAGVAAKTQHDQDVSNNAPTAQSMGEPDGVNGGPDYAPDGTRLYYANGKNVSQQTYEQGLKNLQDWKDATASGNKLPFQDWLAVTGRK